MSDCCCDLRRFSYFSNRIAEFSNQIANRIAVFQIKSFHLRSNHQNGSNRDLNPNRDWWFAHHWTFPWPERMHQHVERVHNILTDWASGDYSYCHHHQAAHSSHCTRLHPPGSVTRLPQRLHAGLHCEHVVSSPPTALLPPPLCCSESSEWSRASLDSWLNGDRQCSVAAYWLLCPSSTVNRFSWFDHEIPQ